GPRSAVGLTHRSLRYREIDRTYGREAGVARGTRCAPGLAAARQLRDLTARHVPRRRRRPAVPDRRPERVRQGLARDPLPRPGPPDAPPPRRTQRTGLS